MAKTVYSYAYWIKKRRKNDFEKDFFKLMNNSVFGKTMENVRNDRDVRIVTSNRQRNKLISGPNYHTTKHFADNRNEKDGSKNG